MYITHDNQTYANVRVYSTSGSVGLQEILFWG